jgi:hypothetical protein
LQYVQLDGRFDLLDQARRFTFLPPFVGQASQVFTRVHERRAFLVNYTAPSERFDSLDQLAQRVATRLSSPNPSYLPSDDRYLFRFGEKYGAWSGSRCA